MLEKYKTYINSISIETLEITEVPDFIHENLLDKLLLSQLRFKANLVNIDVKDFLKLLKNINSPNLPDYLKDLNLVATTYYLLSPSAINPILPASISDKYIQMDEQTSSLLNKPLLDEKIEFIKNNKFIFYKFCKQNTDFNTFVYLCLGLTSVKELISTYPIMDLFNSSNLSYVECLEILLTFIENKIPLDYLTVNALDAVAWRYVKSANCVNQYLSLVATTQGKLTFQQLANSRLLSKEKIDELHQNLNKFSDLPPREQLILNTITDYDDYLLLNQLNLDISDILFLYNTGLILLKSNFSYTKTYSIPQIQKCFELKAEMKFLSEELTEKMSVILKSKSQFMLQGERQFVACTIPYLLICVFKRDANLITTLETKLSYIKTITDENIRAKVLKVLTNQLLNNYKIDLLHPQALAIANYIYNRSSKN